MDTLREAIREGFKQVPQCRGYLFKYESPFMNDTIVGACVLGAAYIGEFGKEGIREMATVDAAEALSKKFPILQKPSITKPGYRVVDYIMHMNDAKGFTVAQILNWLSLEEEAQAIFK